MWSGTISCITYQRPHDTFAALLRQINFQRTDTLYLLGDLIDRGPSSKGVLDTILTMLADGFDVRPLRGNHEQLLLDALEDQATLTVWKGNGGYGTLTEFGISHPLELPERYLKFLSSLPLIYVLDDYVLVHGALDFDKVDPITETDPMDLLWSRNYTFDPTKIAGRTLITGHTATPIFAIRASLTTQHICLDNGCHSKGEMSSGALVALNLDTRELSVVLNCE